jgi:hypothetical protein
MASKRKPAKKRDPNEITVTADSEKDQADALLLGSTKDTWRFRGLPSPSALDISTCFGKTFGSKRLPTSCRRTCNG